MGSVPRGEAVWKTIARRAACAVLLLLSVTNVGVAASHWEQQKAVDQISDVLSKQILARAGANPWRVSGAKDPYAVLRALIGALADYDYYPINIDDIKSVAEQAVRTAPDPVTLESLISVLIRRK